MDLLNKLLDYKNIHLAYERTKNDLINRELYSFQEQNAFELCIPNIYGDISNILQYPDTFEFQNIEILYKPKGWNEEGWDTRPIAKVSFYDLVVIQCVINIIAELISPLLPQQNYGYRLRDKDSTNMYEHWKTGYAKFMASEIDVIKEDLPYRYVLEVDIEKFYPSINHSILLKDLESYIVKSTYTSEINKNEEDILLIWVKKILSIPQIDAFGNKINSNGVGLPQGPLYSPVLALFYIRDCFKHIKQLLARTKYFAYVDDFRFYCETKKQANEIKDELITFFSKLELNINERKTNIFKVDFLKKTEADIMGRASNIGRAIRNDVILSANGKNEIKENLHNLICEVQALYESLLKEGKDISKFNLRIEKFGLYRIAQLIETSNEWYNMAKSLENTDVLTSNYTAMLHVLHTFAKTTKDKQKFLKILESIIFNKELIELTYIKYVTLQYYFIWSPHEVKLTQAIIKDMIDKIINRNILTTTFIKGILSKCHLDWYQLLISMIYQIKFNMDRELNVLLYQALHNLDQTIFNVEYPKEYINKAALRLEQSRLELRYTATINSFNSVELSEYLDDENFKNINYYRLKGRIKKTSNEAAWVVIIPQKKVSLKEYRSEINDVSVQYILRQIFEWLFVQLNYIPLSHKLIPCSVVNPDYIWFDENINVNKGSIILIGNPFLKNEVYYRKVPESIWRSAFIELFESCFDIDIKNLKVEILTQSIQFWQFRIIQLLKARSFNMEKFVRSCLEILRTLDFSTKLSVTSENFRLSHLINHYISDPYLHDKFIEVTRFVESNWKNGSKECFFFTLHNHEHARYLIYIIHDFIEKSGFKIYMNQREAFRLFVACFLHDIGMLSSPPETALFSKDTPTEIDKIFNELLQPLVEAAAIASPVNVEVNSLNKKRVFLIGEFIEQLRMNIVRKMHHEISKNEILWDYPKLPLTTTERRDIAVICNAHGSSLNELYSLEDKVYEARSPINIKMLSCLLRFADLCDVSCMRISKEVLERNEERMGKESLFHWIKHMSVERIELVCNAKDKSKVNINICHNYLPWANIKESDLKKACGNRCKNKINLDYSGKCIPLVHCTLDEEESCIEYLNRDVCNLLCAFINKAYGWFYSEVVFINEYFSKENIDIRLDLSILLIKDEAKIDFNFIENRNTQRSAQEFFVNYLLNA